MVSRPVTVAGVTSNWVQAKTPTVMMMSWASATSAATDIFHWRKYAQMKSTTRTRNTSRPSRARSATSSPQLAPIFSCRQVAGADADGVDDDRA